MQSNKNWFSRYAFHIGLPFFFSFIVTPFNSAKFLRVFVTTTSPRDNNKNSIVNTHRIISSVKPNPFEGPAFTAATTAAGFGTTLS